MTRAVAASLTLLISMSVSAENNVVGAQLPDAPSSHFMLAMMSGAGSSQPGQAQLPHVSTGAGAGPNTNVHTTPHSLRPRLALTLKQAELLAIRNNPRITAGRLQALAAHQVVREVRSAYWPTANANLTAVDSHDNSRITAGGLNNPVIFQRAAGGLTVGAQITDFGHTSNLVASSVLAAKAQDQNALATRLQVQLATDQAFFNILQARAVLRVAQQTVNSRQIVVDQVQALTQSKLKSDLDLSFAQVNLAQAKLLVLDAENNEKAAQAALAALLGYVTPQEFDPVDETNSNAEPPEDLDLLIQQAVNSRPELQAVNYQYQSDEKLKRAERDAMLPTISALAAVGGAPVRDDRLTSWYGAAGVNMEIPIFNGFLFSARAREADLRAQAEQQHLTDMRNNIAKDVRTAWLDASTAYDRLDVTNQLLKQSNLALDLSQTRYKLGLGSIVELSQAELQQTQAEISQSQAGYDYQLALAVLAYQTGQVR